MKKRFFILKYLDNINVRKKLLIIYISCVLLPILSINYVLYASITKWVGMQEMNRVDVYMLKTKNNVIKAIEDCAAVAINVSSDITLNEMMDNEYTDYREYLNDYRIYLSNALLKFMQLYDHIDSVTLYTGNKTIVEGGNYAHINDEVMETEWYKLTLKQGRSIFVYINQDNIDSKQISVIKVINNLRVKDKYLKILKIDINENFFREAVKDETIQGKMFLIDNNKQIVLSNINKFDDDYSKFKNIVVQNIESSHEHKDLVVRKVSLSNISYLNGWQIAGIFHAENIFVELNRYRNYVVLLAIVSLFIATVIVYFISKSLNYRLKSLKKHIKNVRKQNFEIIEEDAGRDEIGELINEYNLMAKKIKELIHDVYQAEINNKNLELERKRAEMLALESQINPHFLYNTLNIIRMKSVLKNEIETAEIIKCVAKTFRRITVWGNDLITIQEELDFITEYLKIQKYRFDNKIEFYINVEPGCLSCRIPKMSIQTFIENACVHGIEKIKDIGVVSLNIYLENPYVCCIVEDNGMGIEQNHLDIILNNIDNDLYNDKSIGIKNVYKRLKSYYVNNFNFSMENKQQGGLRVFLKIPCREETS